MAIFSSDSDGYRAPTQTFFSRQKSMYSILGRGKVADILLWRRKNLSAGILLGITFIWFLFQVLDYTLITLLCRSTIFLMVGLFLWSNGAGFVNCPPPRLPDIRFSESTLRTFFTKIRKFSVRFYDITQGKDMRLFFVIIVSLWVFSVLGNYFSTLNLLYIGFLCIETIPALYEKYKNEIDYLASKVNRDAKKLFKKLNSKVLHKIPRGPSTTISAREKLPGSESVLLLWFSYLQGKNFQWRGIGEESTPAANLRKGLLSFGRLCFQLVSSWQLSSPVLMEREEIKLLMVIIMVQVAQVVVAQAAVHDELMSRSLFHDIEQARS
ncbi:unnamed protein product [Rhodiola kirilowii]